MGIFGLVMLYIICLFIRLFANSQMVFSVLSLDHQGNTLEINETGEAEMNKQILHERAEMVRAMERIARSVNDEVVFEYWLNFGVADGDIDGSETDEDLEYYCEDDNFSELMGCFITLLRRASSGGSYGALFYSGIISSR